MLAAKAKQIVLLNVEFYFCITLIFVVKQEDHSFHCCLCPLNHQLAEHQCKLPLLIFTEMGCGIKKEKTKQLLGYLQTNDSSGSNLITLWEHVGGGQNGTQQIHNPKK